MKKILLVLFLFIGTLTIEAQGIKWMSFDEAHSKQKEISKPLFFYVRAEKCTLCDDYETNTFSQAAISKYINENYYPVKFDAEGEAEIKFRGVVYTNPKYNPQGSAPTTNRSHPFVKKILKAEGCPVLYIIQADEKLSQPIFGNRSAEDLLLALKRI